MLLSIACRIRCANKTIELEQIIGYSVYQDGRDYKNKINRARMHNQSQLSIAPSMSSPLGPLETSKQRTCMLEYRNGIYQGDVKNNKRNGYGILITDDNLIIAGLWKNDLMAGKAIVFLSPKHYGYGDFNRGEIQGMFLWRSQNKTMFSEYNLSRPINKITLIDYQSEKIQTLIHKTPIFQVQSQKPLSPQFTQYPYIESLSSQRFQCLPLTQYLQQLSASSCSTVSPQPLSSCSSSVGPSIAKFVVKSLPNSNLLFTYNDPSNPVSLGLCINKNEELVSCGMYVSDKLNGLGCKYENAVRYEGIFQAGFVHGVGLKFAQAKYSFGHYQAGNLLEALYIDDRSRISQEKLAEFKKLYHLRSIWYDNSYIRRNLLKFKGMDELVFEISSQQDYMYPMIASLLSPKKPQTQTINHSLFQPQTPQRQMNQMNPRTPTNPAQTPNLQQSSSRSSNLLTQPLKNESTLQKSPSRNLALNMLIKREGDKLETKSSREPPAGRMFFGGGGDMQGNSVISQGIPITANGNTKTTVDAKFRNPEDDDDDLNIDEARSSGLRNLRKFKY